MTRKNTLTAYATDDQKAKLAALALTLNLSHSDVMVNLIEKEYHRLFGDTPVLAVV